MAVNGVEVEENPILRVEEPVAFTPDGKPIYPADDPDYADELEGPRNPVEFVASIKPSEPGSNKSMEEPIAYTPNGKPIYSADDPRDAQGYGGK